MPEIYCKIGKLKANLPKEGWDSIRGIEITPCEGCQHHGHKTRLEEMHIGIQADQEIQLENLPVYVHQVSVIESFMRGPREEVVMCECKCRLKYPNFKYPSKPSKLP